jgi:hypothetical protein
MLNKGIKSEEDRRIESIVIKLSSIGFVPDDLNVINEIDEQFKKIGLTYEQLVQYSSNELNQHLTKFNFEWNRMEELADILVQWSEKEPSFKIKAKSLYQYIQDESKVFSFEIMSKIGKL